MAPAVPPTAAPTGPPTTAPATAMPAAPVTAPFPSANARAGSAMVAHARIIPSFVMSPSQNFMPLLNGQGRQRFPRAGAETDDFWRSFDRKLAFRGLAPLLARPQTSRRLRGSREFALVLTARDRRFTIGPMKSGPRKFELTADVLLRAYSIGVFPMAESREASELFWVEPQQRGVFPLDGLIVSKSLAKTVRSDRLSHCRRSRLSRGDARLRRAGLDLDQRRDPSPVLRSARAGHAHSVGSTRRARWSADSMA